MWTAEIQILKKRYDRRSGNCKLGDANKPEKNFATSTGFELMATALALQCSTILAMKTNTLRAGQIVEFILTSERSETWRWCERRK